VLDLNYDVVVESSVADEVKRQFLSQGAYFLSAAEADRLASVLVTPQRLPNPKLVDDHHILVRGDKKAEAANL
jgi:hypothetical protein